MDPTVDLGPPAGHQHHKRRSLNHNTRAQSLGAPTPIRGHRLVILIIVMWYLLTTTCHKRPSRTRSKRRERGLRQYMWRMAAQSLDASGKVSFLRRFSRIDIISRTTWCPAAPLAQYDLPFRKSQTIRKDETRQHMADRIDFIHRTSIRMDSDTR